MAEADVQSTHLQTFERRLFKCDLRVNVCVLFRARGETLNGNFTAH
jgi:hypothetical protein